MAAPEHLHLPGKEPGKEPGQEPARRGRHKIYVGMAAGVGKTTRALHELRDHLNAGEDALIGLLETHGRAGTIQAAAGLPLFPRREIVRGSVTLGELDVDGLLSRRPQISLIDELAHTNAPGSAREKRWQDVEVLLSAGIDIISTLNVQHLESLHDTVARLTGVRVRERIPDHVLEEADELVLVDVSPDDLQARLLAGKIYTPDKVDQAISNFFSSANLTALRELALRQIADAVEEVPGGLPGVHERVMVACAPEERAARLIRRAGRMAERLGAELYVVTVRPASLSGEQSRFMDVYRDLTAALGGSYSVLEGGGDVARVLAAFARDHNITQIVIGESSRSRWQLLLRGDIIGHLLRETRNVDVYVISRD